MSIIGRVSKKMEKGSSCIAIFSEYTDAKDTVNRLASFNVDENRISLVGRDLQQGKVAAGGIGTLDDDLNQLGVQEGSLYCYQCLVHGGSFLVIVSGDYEEVERACRQLEKHEKADVSIHFNSARKTNNFNI
ncbi:MAG: hypothetical protein DSZ28_09420 [Thiothrix sp.]|nr:MAG: hypothetical protein DSZ28_09420 [Thiothrix sp.]